MIPLKLKEGVKLTDLKPQVVLAVFAAKDIWDAKGAADFVITSVNDSKHGTNSLHFSGNAVDLRTSNLPGGYTGRAAVEAATELRVALGKEFDVVLEEDHIHVEYDPK